MMVRIKVITMTMSKMLLVMCKQMMRISHNSNER